MEKRANTMRSLRGDRALRTLEHADLEQGLSLPQYPQQRRNYAQHVPTSQIKPDHLLYKEILFVPPTARHQASRMSSQSTLRPNRSTNDHGSERNITEADPIDNEPAPKYSIMWMNVLRWEVFSVYRRLNLIVILANMIIVVVLATKGLLVQMDPGTMSTALIANITLAVIFRQEYVINGLFVLFGCCPPSWPLWIRKLAAKIYHFGGVHSGAGIASLIWLGLFDLSLVLHYRTVRVQHQRDVWIISIASTLNTLLLCVVITSYPKFREKHHNVWEAIHRFGGWLAVALFWAGFGLLEDQNRQRDRPTELVFNMLITSPTFWMLTTVTVFLVMPWLRLRKVDVVVEEQSQYTTRLHFDYTNLSLCSAPRLSTRPLMEWHSFAGIPEPNGVGFSVLISGVGDWTRDIIENPPKQLWVRGIPVRGVLHLAPIFNRIVLVATGSGIGPVLSLLHARAIDCRILWCTRSPELMYQPAVIEAVKEADPNARIISRVRGQRDPELGKMAYDLWKESGAEAVFIISNKAGCYQARIWLESRGVVAFTPIFDS